MKARERTKLTSSVSGSVCVSAAGSWRGGEGEGDRKLCVRMKLVFSVYTHNRPVVSGLRNSKKMVSGKTICLILLFDSLLPGQVFWAIKIRGSIVFYLDRKQFCL